MQRVRNLCRYPSFNSLPEFLDLNFLGRPFFSVAKTSWTWFGQFTQAKLVQIFALLTLVGRTFREPRSLA